MEVADPRELSDPLPEEDRPRVLYLAAPRDDYLADTLLVGLRRILGEDLVDVPVRDSLYRELAPPPEEIYGHGFSVWRLLETLDLDRSDVRDRARQGEFDVVVWASIHRQKALFREWERDGALEEADAAMVFLDGEDPVPDGPLDRAKRRAIDEVKRRLPVPYDRTYAITPVFSPAVDHGLYLKTRLTEGMLERHPDGTLLSFPFAIPAEKVRRTPEEKEKPFVKHVQNEEAYGLEEVRQGSTQGKPFDTEEGYYDDIARSRYGVVQLKPTGFECMRMYEVAGNLTVPTFHNLQRKTFHLAPHGLVDMHNCVSFRTAGELRRKIDLVEEGGMYEAMVANVADWMRWQTSEVRAKQLLAYAGAMPEDPAARTPPKGPDRPVV